jgi:hypothetical protein
MVSYQKNNFIFVMLIFLIILEKGFRRFLPSYIIRMNFTPKAQKAPKKFVCEKCDFKCFKTSDWERHTSTDKHQIRTFTNFDEAKKRQTEKKYECPCGKAYKHSSSLWNHRKLCKKEENTIGHNEKEMIMMLIKENKDFKDMMMEQNNKMIELCKDKSIIMNNTTNSHNKTFNLNVFLNETCKDAMNIMDFVNNVKIKITDLENVGTLGYIDGITNIIVKNMKELDVSKRPVHCSDLKREILYIKDENKWSKENDEREKLRLAIQHIAHKNIQMLPEWKQENPEYSKDEGKTNDKYLKIIMQCMGGSDKQEDIQFQDKIISKLAKCVIINK